MIDVKQAVRTAYDYIQSVYPEELHGLRLEEVELSEDERRWLITMGFLEEQDPATLQQPANALEALAMIRTAGPREARRTYKRIEIDADTGEPKAMKIRQL